LPYFFYALAVDPEVGVANSGGRSDVKELGRIICGNLQVVDKSQKGTRKGDAELVFGLR
jgi:hypothetical protein